MRHILAVCSLAVLMSCAPGTPGPTPAQVAAIEVGVAQAESMALTYIRQPNVTPARKALVQRDGQTAHDAVVALRTDPTNATLSLATTALTALRADIAKE